MGIAERAHKLGTIFKFPGFGGYFILARMSTSLGDDDFYNLISLRDGNIKTTSWQSSRWTSGQGIIIPEYTWNCGGPPTVVYISCSNGSSNREDNADDLKVLSLIKHDDLLGKNWGKNFNRELIESIKG